MKGENNKLYKILLREMGTEEWLFWRVEVISHLDRILPVEKQGQGFDWSADQQGRKRLNRQLRSFLRKESRKEHWLSFVLE